MLIDDEADNASINYNKPEEDPTSINECINELMGIFDNATYLGVTATPFANIFIKGDVDPDTKRAEDIFPRDFFQRITPPKQYMGVNQFFEVDEERDEDIERYVIPIQADEIEEIFPVQHKQGIADDLAQCTPENALPKSLQTAILYYILAAIIDEQRLLDKSKVQSMLVNVSRFNKVQDVIYDKIKEYLEKVEDDVKANHMMEPKVSYMKELYDTWRYYELEKKGCEDWKEIAKKLPAMLDRIKLVVINQQHSNGIDYENNNFRYIIIGGNSLSRGLTLEGLCVSYYARSTSAADTLLQMGRWFGYREGYKDLVKVWVYEEAIGWYSYVREVIQRLECELRSMEKRGQTPEQFGILVRNDPDVLRITSSVKMRNAEVFYENVSFSGRSIESAVFSRSESMQENEDVAMKLLEKAEQHQPAIDYTKNNTHPHSHYLWTDIDKSYVKEFLKDFKYIYWNGETSPQAIVDYIDSADLDTWDIALGSLKNSDKIRQVSIGGRLFDVAPQSRSFDVVEYNDDTVVRINKRRARFADKKWTQCGLSPEDIEKIDSLNAEAGNGNPSAETYLNDWEGLSRRKPILALFQIQLKNEDMKSEVLKDIPETIWVFALGFPKGDTVKTVKLALRKDMMEKVRLRSEEEAYDEV